MEKGNTVYSFTYDPAGHPVSFTEGNDTYYYILNQQGDVIGIVDDEGIYIVSYVYDAWGLPIKTQGTERLGIGERNPLRYRGYVYDTETELYYLQSRYYNPEMGRFINADDPGYMGVDGTPSSYNLFSYCGNNPVTRADDEGEFWHIVIGAAVGLVTQYVSDVVSNLMDGDSFLKALVPSSSLIDYGAAALSGAVGATGIGFWGSVAANAGISGGQYLANCAMEGEDMSLGGFALAIGEGALSGRKGTGSKHYTKLGTQTMKRTFNAGVHKGFKAGLSECGRAFAYYAKNTKTYYKKALRGLRNDLVITSVNTVAESILFGG